jgi:hypothetical protein
MLDEVSPRVLEKLSSGIFKYTRWAQRLSPESLESLLWAVGVFSTQYNAARRTTGRNPTLTFAPHYMAEDRMSQSSRDDFASGARDTAQSITSWLAR